MLPEQTAVIDVGAIGHRRSPANLKWWKNAACASHDPEWWSGDLSMRQAAVKICLTCPVRRSCTADAKRLGDTGVVRGAMLFTKSRQNRPRVVDLVCVQCGARPVIMTKTGQDTLCGGYRCTFSLRHASAA
jgi:Transcription factor WhiB